MQLASLHCWTLRPRYTHSSQVHRLHWSKPSTTWFNFNVTLPKGKAMQGLLEEKERYLTKPAISKKHLMQFITSHSRATCQVKGSECRFPTTRTQSPCCQLPPWCPPRPTCWGPKVCNGKLKPHYTVYNTQTHTHMKNNENTSRSTSYLTTLPYNYRPQSVKPLWTLCRDSGVVVLFNALHPEKWPSMIFNAPVSALELWCLSQGCQPQGMCVRAWETHYRSRHFKKKEKSLRFVW